MKYFKTIAIVVLLTATFSTFAQNKNEVEVKVLPSLEKGFIKVLVVTDNVSDIEVKFYNPEGLFTIDKISKNSYQKGFLKKYDVHRVHDGEAFWIDVTAEGFEATYKVTGSKDQSAYETQLARKVNRNLMVASLD